MSGRRGRPEGSPLGDRGPPRRSPAPVGGDRRASLSSRGSVLRRGRRTKGPGPPALHDPENDSLPADSQDSLASQGGGSVRPASVVTTIDGEGGVGTYPSIAVGSAPFGLLR